MKKTFVSIVFLAAAHIAFANGSWASSDRVVYDGESEILFSYTGPEGVFARVYEDGAFLGSLSTGESKRRIANDGDHTFRVHSGVYNAETKQTVEDPQSLTLHSAVRKNRSRVHITIAKINAQNRVTNLALIDTAAIQTQPKPPPEQTSQNPPGAQAQRSGADNAQKIEQLTATAQRHKEKGAYDEVAAAYAEIIRLDPNNARAYASRGLAYAATGDLNRASADFTQALRLDANYAEAYFGRGVVYYVNGDYSRARADWERALRLNPTLAAARNNLEGLRQRGY